MGLHGEPKSKLAAQIKGQKGVYHVWVRPTKQLACGLKNRPTLLSCEEATLCSETTCQRKYQFIRLRHCKNHVKPM